MKVVWSKPDAPRPSVCSSCFGPLPRVPLTMWTEDGHAASFCDTCADKFMRQQRMRPYEKK
jgi:hypothetical protein